MDCSPSQGTLASNYLILIRNVKTLNVLKCQDEVYWSHVSQQSENCNSHKQKGEKVANILNVWETLRFIPSLISLVNNIFDVMMRSTGSKEGKRELKGSTERERERHGDRGDQGHELLFPVFLSISPAQGIITPLQLQKAFQWDFN